MGLTRNKRKTPTFAGRRLALVICNGGFRSVPNQLVGPAKDAKLLETVLSDSETCRFSVCVLVNRGLLEVRREIARICTDASENDTLLIYYSGNGFLDQDESLYLVVADSDGKYPHATALDAEFILSQLRNSRCRRIILMVDACHAGAFFTQNRGIPNGLYAITSCGAKETCADTPEGGAFTLALCAGLRDAAADTDGDGLVSIDELHEFVKQKLRADGHMGLPQKWVWNVPEPIFVTAVPRHVFLSYAREDMAKVDRLAQALQAGGLSVWVDRKGIQSGNWKERVTDGLNRARAVVVLLTSTSFASSAVRKELAFAAKKNVPIIPVQLEQIPDKLVPDWFTLDYDELHCHAIDAKRYDEGVKELASAICTLRIPNLQGRAREGPTKDKRGRTH
ncbi:MAG TPA: TIR domain-containing protein [Nitrospira sp.]|nr:TIR domain-containing protein [Nitrospira sp.]